VLDIPADHRNLNSILNSGEAGLTRPLLVSTSDSGPEMGPRNVRTDRRKCHDRKNLRPCSRDGPGYSIGTGAARVGDGSDPSYLGNQGKLELEPGYSVGTGAARSSGTR